MIKLDSELFVYLAQQLRAGTLDRIKLFNMKTFNHLTITFNEITKHFPIATSINCGDIILVVDHIETLHEFAVQLEDAKHNPIAIINTSDWRVSEE